MLCMSLIAVESHSALNTHKYLSQFQVVKFSYMFDAFFDIEKVSKWPSHIGQQGLQIRKRRGRGNQIVLHYRSYELSSISKPAFISVYYMPFCTCLPTTSRNGCLQPCPSMAEFIWAVMKDVCCCSLTEWPAGGGWLGRVHRQDRELPWHREGQQALPQAPGRQKLLLGLHQGPTP